MIDDRRAAILQAVVQQYIETSQPVSSSHVTQRGVVDASSATVRGDMASLEREGYLQQPHTSAGRVPTDRGYRFFVDQLHGPARLGRSQQHDVREFFAQATGEIEQMLHETGLLLSKLTGAAAVVVGGGATPEAATVVSAQLVALNTRVALIVLVFSNGVVDKHTVDLPEGTAESLVSQASVCISQILHGRALVGLAPNIRTGDQQLDALLLKVFDAITPMASRAPNHIYVGGASRVAESFEAVETVRNVLSILEQQYVVVSLIRDLLDRGAAVSIGAENNLQPLAQCSLVVAPTVIDGEQRGSVAVLGPTRMDYAQAMAAVTIVGRRLGNHLSNDDNSANEN